MGYGIASAAGLQGGYATLDALVQARRAQALMAQQHAEHLQQQQFDNERTLHRERTGDEQTSYLRQRQEGLDAERQTEHDITQGDKLNESIPGDTRLDPRDRAVGYLRTAGVPLQPVPGVQAMGPEFQGPMQNGVTPQQAQTGIGAGFLKTASAKQQDTATDNQRQADAITRQRESDADRQRHEQAMERIAQQNANTSANKPNTADASRGDRSYQYHMGQIDKLATPFASQLDRLTRLQQSIDQGTAVADSVIAPELISALAGGQGSGVRITQAELNAVTHGRSTVEDVKGWLQKVQNGQSITPEQRQQMRVLVGAVHHKAQQKAAAIDQARGALIDATDPAQHRQIYGGLQHTLNDMASDSAPGQAQPAGGLVLMVAPDGRALNVPADKVAELEAKGAKRR